MKYFQYLDLDWKPVADKLKHFVLNNKELVGYDQGGWKSIPIVNFIHIIPDVIKMLSPIDAIPTRISFHITYQANNCIHKDASINSCSRILLPIMNCEGSITKFYRSDKEPNIGYQVNGVPLYHKDIELSDCEFMEEYHLDRAVAMRPRELHSVYTTNDNFPRISCPIEVNKDLSHLFI